MDMEQILRLLIAERDRLDRAIEALGGPARRDGAGTRGSRKNPATAGDQNRKKPRRGRMSAAARKAVSERMTKYWAARRKKQAKP